MSKDHGVSLRKRPTKMLLIILSMTFIYMIAEGIGGFYTNSLSLLADAGHMLADVSAICISLAAFYISARPATARSTFGFQRAEVLAALFNSVILLLSAFLIVKEAILRLFSPEPIETDGMILIAFGGLLVNLFSLFLIGKEREENLNLKGAWLHILSDTLGSVAVIISGTIIYFFEWNWFDPIASILICILIVISSFNLLSKTLSVLMEQVPSHINMQEVEKIMLSNEFVLEIHDLHIWSITLGNEALSAHVLVSDKSKAQEVLLSIQEKIKEKIGITHSTIQIETKCHDSNTVC